MVAEGAHNEESPGSLEQANEDERPTRKQEASEGGQRPPVQAVVEAEEAILI